MADIIRYLEGKVKNLYWKVFSESCQIECGRIQKVNYSKSYITFQVGIVPGDIIIYMQIVLSAHFDVAKPVPYIELSDSKLRGLIDNFAGVFVAYEVAKKTGIPLYLTNFEESGMRGAREVAKKLKKETLVIVVDTTRDAGIKSAYIGNVYNLKLPKKLPKDIFIMPGYFEETEDETWVYGHKFGLPCFYFGVPIKKAYHATNNVIGTRTLDKATKVLLGVLQALNRF